VAVKPYRRGACYNAPSQLDLFKAGLGQLFTFWNPDDRRLVFVSHDREFVSSLATRIIELRPGKPGAAATLIDFHGNYDDYLADHGAEMAAA